MKKILLSLALSLGMVFAAPVASTFAATQVNTVYGKVTNNGVPVAGATVRATCDTSTGEVSGSATSASDGSYGINLVPPQICTAGDPVHVTAQKGSAVGAKTVKSGNDVNNVAVNLTVADVTVGLPEMGTIMGGLAAVGAGGAFLIVRRKQQANY